MSLSNLNLPQPKKIVLTGGPGVGKTSVLHYFTGLGYDVREEVFTRHFSEAHLRGDFNDAFLESKELLENLIQSQKDLEAQKANGQFVFLDRCRVDILGFCKNIGINPPPGHLEWLTNNEYDLVFILDPLPAALYERNPIRRQSQFESLEHHKNITQHYSDFAKFNHLDPGKFLVRVPYFSADFRTSVELRGKFILDRINRPQILKL